MASFALVNLLHGCLSWALLGLLLTESEGLLST